MTFKLLTAALLSATCIVGAAQAVTLNVDLIVNADNTGNFIGQTGTAVLEYADSDATPDAFLEADPQPLVIPGLGSFPAGPGYDIISMNVLGQAFSDSDDPDSFVSLDSSSNPNLWSFSLDRTLGDTINNPFVISFSTQGSFFDNGGGRLGVNVLVNDVVAPIPLPATALLLGTTLLGAGGLLRARRKKA